MSNLGFERPTPRSKGSSVDSRAIETRCKFTVWKRIQRSKAKSTGS